MEISYCCIGFTENPIYKAEIDNLLRSYASELEGFKSIHVELIELPFTGSTEEVTVCQVYFGIILNIMVSTFPNFRTTGNPSIAITPIDIHNKIKSSLDTELPGLNARIGEIDF